MVKHCLVENEVNKQRSGGEHISRGQHSISVIEQAKMSCSKTGHSKNVERKPGAKNQSTNKPSGKRKKVRVEYIDPTSSDDASTDDYSSNNNCSSYCSDDESPPPKRTKKSSERGVQNGYLEKDSEEEDTEYSSEEQEEEYVVEKIVGMMRNKDGKRFFRVKWLNYPREDNTWEPLENLSKCRDLVKEFLARHERSDSRSNNNNYKQNSKNHVSVKTHRGKNAKDNQNLTKEANKNNHFRKNDFSETSVIRNSMISTAHKVVDIESRTEQKPKKTEERPKMRKEMSENVNEQEKSSIQAKKQCLEVKLSLVNKQVQDVTTVNQYIPDQYLAIPHAGDLYYVKIIDETDGTVNWLHIDLSTHCADPDTLYKCIVTEDLTGKQPKLIYGATEDINGEKFCMVQFEGYSYVEIIPPTNFFMKFPSLKEYFEIHCPHIFIKNSH